MFRISLVACDWFVFVLLSLMKPLRYVLDSIVAKTKDVLEAILLCKDLGFTNYFFEGNSSKVVAAVNSCKLDYGFTGPLMYDIKVFAYWYGLEKKTCKIWGWFIH